VVAAHAYRRDGSLSHVILADVGGMHALTTIIVKNPVTIDTELVPILVRTNYIQRITKPGVFLLRHDGYIELADLRWGRPGPWPAHDFS
jgi:hypothetical protein